MAGMVEETLQAIPDQLVGERERGEVLPEVPPQLLGGQHRLHAASTI